MKSISQYLKSVDTWKRALFMLLFSLIYMLVEFVIFGVAIFQLGHMLVTGKTNAQLLPFGQSLSTYVYQIMCYLTFSSEKLPFPFAEWPTGRP